MFRSFGQDTSNIELIEEKTYTLYDDDNEVKFRIGQTKTKKFLVIQALYIEFIDKIILDFFQSKLLLKNLKDKSEEFGSAETMDDCYNIIIKSFEEKKVEVKDVVTSKYLKLTFNFELKPLEISLLYKNIDNSVIYQIFNINEEDLKKKEIEIINNENPEENDADDDNQNEKENNEVSDEINQNNENEDEKQNNEIILNAENHEEDQDVNVEEVEKEDNGEIYEENNQAEDINNNNENMENQEENKENIEEIVLKKEEIVVNEEIVENEKNEENNENDTEKEKNNEENTQEVIQEINEEENEKINIIEKIDNEKNDENNSNEEIKEEKDNKSNEGETENNNNNDNNIVIKEIVKEINDDNENKEEVKKIDLEEQNKNTENNYIQTTEIIIESKKTEDENIDNNNIENNDDNDIKKTEIIIESKNTEDEKIDNNNIKNTQNSNENDTKEERKQNNESEEENKKININLNSNNIDENNHEIIQDKINNNDEKIKDLEQEYNNKINELLTKIKSLEEENNCLKEENITLKEENSNLKNNNNTLLKEKETTKDELDSLNKKNILIKKESDLIITEKNAIKEENDKLKQEKESIQKENDLLKKENENLKKDNNIYKEKLSKANLTEEKLKKSNQENNNLKVELQKLKNEIKRFNEENNKNKKNVDIGNVDNIPKKTQTYNELKSNDSFEEQKKRNSIEVVNKENKKNEIDMSNTKNNIINNNKTAAFQSKSPINLKVSKTLTNSSYIEYTMDNAFDAFTTLSGNVLLVYATKFKSIECFDIVKQKFIKTLLNAHTSLILIIKYYCPKFMKKEIILSSSNAPDYCVKIWDIKNWTCILNFNKIYDKGNMLAVCLQFDEFQKESYIFTSNDFGPIKIWGFNGKFIKNINKSENNETYFLDTYYDDLLLKYFLICGEMKCCKSYELNTHQLFRTYLDNTSCAEHTSAFINKNGNTVELVECEFYGYIRIWNFRSGDLIKKIEVCKRIPLVSMCLWNKNYLLASCVDYTIKLIDFKNYAFIKSFNGHNNEVSTIKKIMHPTYGECLISQGLANEQIKMWINS